MAVLLAAVVASIAAEPAVAQSALHPYTGVPPHLRAVIDGYDDPFLPHLVAHLDRATHVDIAVAFTAESGVRVLADVLGSEDLEDRVVGGDAGDVVIRGVGSDAFEPLAGFELP